MKQLPSFANTSQFVNIIYFVFLVLSMLGVYNGCSVFAIADWKHYKMKWLRTIYNVLRVLDKGFNQGTFDLCFSLSCQTIFRNNIPDRRCIVCSYIVSLRRPAPISRGRNLTMTWNCFLICKIILQIWFLM